MDSRLGGFLTAPPTHRSQRTSVSIAPASAPNLSAFELAQDDFPTSRTVTSYAVGNRSPATLRNHIVLHFFDDDRLDAAVVRQHIPRFYRLERIKLFFRFVWHDMHIDI